MKLLIAGTRKFKSDKHYQLLEKICDPYLKNYDDISVICGGAEGADSLGQRWAEENNLPVIMVKPTWYENGQYNPYAGHTRNTQMAKMADMAVIFWNGKSRGTEDMINKSFDNGVDYLVVEYLGYTT